MSFYISRFKGMETKEFNVEVVTPMFLGGADTKKAELRVPSIKGALRFWWRVIYGSDDLEDMKKREDSIFGSTTEKASFSLQLRDTESIKPVLANPPQGIKVPTQSKGKTFSISIIEYLAYGLYEYRKDQKKNIFIKEHLPSGKKFRIVFIIKNELFNDQILDSLKMLTNYGGLGSHSRNGFGSINIDSLSRPVKMEGELKSFTALSSKSILFNRFSLKDKWEGALSEIGKAYRDARNSLENRHSFVKRPLIAKPLIVKGEVKIEDRHSKPYFLHVNKFPNGKYQGQILFMPYNYHCPSKRKEYFETCEKMNQKLYELSGGSK